MSEALVIRFGGDPAAVQYLLVDAAGGRLGAVIEGPIAQAAPLSVGRRVVVIAPAVEIVLATPELPAKNAARLAQLAPYALEEQLATDIDDMHFAIGRRGASGKTSIAAVPRQLIENWLATLGQAGIQPDAMYAETSLLPTTNGGVTLVLDKGLLYVQPVNATGFVLDARPLADAMHLALGREEQRGESATEQFVGDIQFYVSQSDYETQNTALSELHQTFPGVQIKLLQEGSLPLLALQLTQDTAVNLLTGTFERKSSLSTSFAPWRFAAVLLGIAVSLQIAYGGLRLWQTARTERQLDAQIREITSLTLPGANLSDARDARRLFEARLGALKQGDGRNDLMMSLGVLGDALAATSGARIESLFYRRAQSVDLRISAPNVDTLDKIQQTATAGGLATQIQSATPRDNRVEGRLQFKL